MATADIPSNWAGNQRYQAIGIHRPVSVTQVQELVARSRRVKAVGTRHSFNGIADTTGDHLSLERLNRIVSLDRDARTVTIEGGVRYGELGPWLHREGFALPNLASLPHISVAGAVATATHGSGDRLGNLATAVAALEVVTDDGTIVTFSRQEDPIAFFGAVVGLGALGVVTRLTLNVEPAYEVVQLVAENLTFAQVETHFDAITSSATSVSLFTDWRGDRFHQVWLKQRIDRAPAEPPVGFFGATLARVELHPLPGHAAENCTRQLGVAGPWHERLPHFRLEFTPSSGAELQSEYFVPRHHAMGALRALVQLRSRIVPLVMVSEVRTIAADDLWLSPCYRQACVAIHFTWKPDWPAVQKLLPAIEHALAPFDARPHWGKLFTMAPEQLRALYPKLSPFEHLRQRYDPTGKFRNAFLDACVSTSPA